jgi:hypothetical protein
MSRKYIRADKAHILVVGNRDDVADRLKQFSAEGKINFYDAFGNPVKSANTTLPAGLTAEQVIEDYLNAIGGRGKIVTITDMETKSTMQMRGPSFNLTTYQKGGNKILVEMSMNGQVMNKQLFDGQSGAQSAMGQVENLDEASIADMKEQAKICKEADYKTNGYKLNLKKMEEVNGVMAFVIEVTRPDGEKITEYYDTKTSLKLREVSMDQGPDGNPAIQTVDMSDYKEVNGVKMPHVLTISGVFPVPFKVNVSEIKVNGGIKDDVFKL